MVRRRVNDEAARRLISIKRAALKRRKLITAGQKQPSSEGLLT